MKDVSVYLIDPGVTVRFVLSMIIREAEGISMSGTYSGSNVEKTHNLIRSHNPDVLLFGIDKKNSTAMELFLSLRRNFPALPIIVITPLDRQGAAVALDVLKKGAVDYITRPVNREGTVMARRHFKKRVLPVLKSIPELNMDMVYPEQAIIRLEKKAKTVPDYRKRSSKQAEIVVVGGSTGGVQALYRLLSTLPEKLPVPVVIVQHMPKIYTEILADDLNRVTPLNVFEAKNGNLLHAGQVYIIPGGYHSVVGMNGYRKTLYLHRGPREHKNRPSIDVLLGSVSHIYREKALGVILSGYGLDGLRGAEIMVNAGGQIIIPDHTSTLLWNLPEKIMNCGICTGIYPMKRLGFEIIQRIKPIDKAASARRIKKRYEGLTGNRKGSDFSTV